jgi:hypothetical protein
MVGLDLNQPLLSGRQDMLRVVDDLANSGPREAEKQDLLSGLQAGASPLRLQQCDRCLTRARTTEDQQVPGCLQDLLALRIENQFHRC